MAVMKSIDWEWLQYREKLISLILHKAWTEVAICSLNFLSYGKHSNWAEFGMQCLIFFFLLLLSFKDIYKDELVNI